MMAACFTHASYLYVLLHREEEIYLIRHSVEWYWSLCGHIVSCAYHIIFCWTKPLDGSLETLTPPALGLSYWKSILVFSICFQCNWHARVIARIVRMYKKKKCLSLIGTAYRYAVNFRTGR